VHPLHAPGESRDGSALANVIIRLEQRFDGQLGRGSRQLLNSRGNWREVLTPKERMVPCVLVG
jgi:hypothetical protein